MLKRDTGRYMTYKGNTEAGEGADPGAIIESMVHQLVVNCSSYKVCAWLSICDRLLHDCIERTYCAPVGQWRQQLQGAELGFLFRPFFLENLLAGVQRHQLQGCNHALHNVASTPATPVATRRLRESTSNARPQVSCLGLQKTVVGLREETEIAQVTLSASRRRYVEHHVERLADRA